MILVFDLDDTLYEEITYVKSSFRAVANYLSAKYALKKEEVYQELVSTMETQGRGAVFNEVLQQHNIFSQAEVKRCLAVYRKNKPEIHLADEARECLERFGQMPKYLVTDGNKMVQTTKIRALGLEEYFKKTLPTHNYGLHRSKPSTYLFHKILKWENSKPGDLVYIGDNPNKDFVNLKKEGFKTVRVFTGMFKDLKREEEFEADFEINSLNELDSTLLESIFEKEL